MKKAHSFEEFLESFVSKISSKTKQLNKALWILETTGSQDAADLKAELDTELRLFFNDKEIYQKLLNWDKDSTLKDPILKRQLNVLIRGFKQNIIPQDILKAITEKEAALLCSYANFRPVLDGISLSENDIRDILKTERDPKKRQKAWNASKDIGEVLASQILDLVELRNQAAKAVGYPDYFTMQLDLQEVDEEWLFRTLDDLAGRSDAAYSKILSLIEQEQRQHFQVNQDALGPWAWSDPFCQEDPIGTRELDPLVDQIDMCDVSVKFYAKMGIDITPILKRSDMLERPGKNQHAFCINVDRESDVRTLNNIAKTLKWLEIVFHEFGHAIYEMGYDPKLPWLLREPAHMLTTEAMALIAGRQAYIPEVLADFVPPFKDRERLMKKAKESLVRRQLIFSRWVLVMTYFERELYRNPKQNLNKLWWEMVNKYQKINIPKGREGKCDWAAKYHIGLAPVYYYSYLLGEMFASAIEEAIEKETGSSGLESEKVGRFLQQRLFFPGNRMNWRELVKHTVGKDLTADAWLSQFAK